MAAKSSDGLGDYSHLDDLTAADYRAAIRANSIKNSVMPTLTKLEQTWRMVESLSAKQQEKLAARMNALVALKRVESGQLQVLPNSLTMADVRREQKAARAARRHA